MRVALTPTHRDREFFRVHFVNAGVMQGFDCPADSAVSGGRAGDAAANCVGEVTQILFQRRRAERALNHRRR